MSTRFVLLAALLCLSQTGLAAAASDSWEAGKTAFAAGDFELALDHFHVARDDGLEGPAVHYNIGVIHFELGQYDYARESFTFIAANYPRMAGLAEYNLGLISRRQGLRDDAGHHFLRAYELSDDEKIRILASQRIRELEPETRTVSRWSGAYGIRAGNDDNVALRDEAGVPVGTTTESPMADVFASFIGPRTGRDGFRLRGSAYLIRYADADEFDQSEFRLGGLYEWRRNNWRAELDVHATASTLGRDAFDRKFGAGVRLVRYFGNDNIVDLRYSYDDVSEGEDIFAGIAGSRQRLDARYRWYHEDHSVQLRYVLETNDRLDPSVSPERNRIVLDYRFEPLTGFGYEAGVEFRQSEFADISIPRDEDLVTLFGVLSYAFANDWNVLLEYRQGDNESTDPTYTYDRREITLGVMRYF